MKNADLQELVLGLLTDHEIRQAFGRTKMTIYVWRREDNLPFIDISGCASRPTIRYNPKAVLSWALSNGRKIVDPTPFRRVGVTVPPRLLEKAS